MVEESIVESENYEIEIVVDESFRSALDDDNLRTAAIATLQHEHIEAGALTIIVTDNEAMRGFNLQYRDMNSVTDVLSFAAHEGEDSFHDLPPELVEEMEADRGDIVIAYPYTVDQANRYGNSIAAEFRLLVVHGTLHLLGYDHDTPERQDAMWSAQRQILHGLGDQSINWERESEP